MDKLFEKLEAIQKQPVHTRKRILFISTGVMSALVFFFWLSLFPAKLQKLENRNASTTSPFAALIGTVREAGKGFSGVGEAFKSELKYVKENGQLARPSTTPKVEGMGTTSPATSSPKEAE